MSGFNKIKPKKYGYTRQKVQGSIFSKLYQEAIDTSYKVPTGRAPELRPSAFPMCSILTWIKLVKRAHLGYWEREKSFAGDFFTSIGTQAHSITQYHIGDSGKIWGNWRCINPKCKEGSHCLANPEHVSTKHTTHNKCKICKHSMEYVEIEVTYKGIKGHIDCIIYLGNKKYWVGDYKTTTRRKIDSGKLPEIQHLMQVPAYVYILRTEYKMDVVGFSLLYLSRDNPFYFVEKSFDWSDKWQVKMKILLRTQRVSYMAALDTLLTKNLDTIIETKLCTSREFYDTNVKYYTPCPLLNKCFEPKLLRRELNNVLEDMHYSAKEAVKIVNDLRPV
jgi:hypothetical protein